MYINLQQKKEIHHSRCIQRVDVHLRRTILLGWDFPKLKWCKLNADRSTLENPGLLGFGFVVNISHGTSLVVELWTLWKELQLACNLGIKHLEVESDSKVRKV